MRVTFGGVITTGIFLTMLYGSYQVFVVGNPAVVKFRDECHRRYTGKYMPGSVPDDVIQTAVIRCEGELQQRLREGPLN